MSILDQVKNQQVKQSILLLFSTAISMLMLLGSNYFLTKIFSPEQFGNYYFIINIFVLCQTIFNFGIFQSASRLIAISDNNKKNREFYAAGLIFIFLLYILMSICLLIYALNSSNIKEKDLLHPFLIAIPFGWVYLLTNFNELLLQGSNKIGLLAQARLLPRTLFFIILGIIFYSHLSGNLNKIIVLYFVSYICSYLYIVYKIKPSFSNLKDRTKEIISANKKFGFHIYIGALISVGVTSLSGILISYYGVDNTSVGYFSIATQICAPLALIPNVMATAFFRQFANSERINPKITRNMLFLSLVCLIIVLILAKPVILYIYGNEYLDAVTLVIYLAIGALLYGIADFYNRFLLSKGKGKELRNAAFLVGISLLLANIILIKYYGAIGAAISKVIAGIIYFTAIFTLYKRVCRENKTII